MSFKAWRKWLKGLRMDVKWFVLLILFRPIIDTTSRVRMFSVSPLEILGVLIFVLMALFALTSKRRPQKIPDGPVDISMRLFTVLLSINLFFLCILHPEWVNIGNSLKFILPFYLYFYLKNRLSSKDDFHGILQTSLYASIIPFSILIYESLMGPIAPQIDFRGQVYYKGLYADPFYYSITFFLAYSIVVYFYIMQGRSASRWYGHLVGLIFCLGLLVLVKIHHNLSNVVFAVVTIFSLLVILRYKNNVIIRIGLFLGVGALLFVGYDIAVDGFYSTFRTELSILSGDVPIERAFHGRVHRWINYFEIWKDLNPIFNLIGVPLSGDPLSGVMISGGMHSDYVRILFATGWMGFGIYVFMLIKIFFLKTSNDKPLIALRNTLLIVVALFSVTSLPINYQPLMYIFISVLVYSRFQKNKTKKKILNRIT